MKKLFVLLFGMLMLTGCFFENKDINDDKNNTIASLLALTISLIAMSSIEITINLFFFGLLSLLIVTEKTFDNRK